MFLFPLYLVERGGVSPRTAGGLDGLGLAAPFFTAALAAGALAWVCGRHRR